MSVIPIQLIRVREKIWLEEEFWKRVYHASDKIPGTSLHRSWSHDAVKITVLGVEIRIGRVIWFEARGKQSKRLPEVSALFGFDPQRFRPRGFGPFQVRPPIYENVSFCQYFFVFFVIPAFKSHLIEV